jgi:hypothetical protein
MDKAEYSEDIYERLAVALDLLPHGFARTSSGVELKLIKIAFTPEEVWLAGQLTRFPETAEEIAARVGRDVTQVRPTLESLIPRRLVRLNSPDMLNWPLRCRPSSTKSLAAIAIPPYRWIVGF